MDIKSYPEWLFERRLIGADCCRLSAAVFKLVHKEFQHDPFSQTMGFCRVEEIQEELPGAFVCCESYLEISALKSSHVDRVGT